MKMTPNERNLQQQIQELRREMARSGREAKYPITKADCGKQNEIQIINIFGQPTGGMFGIDLTLNDVEENIEIDWDAADTDIKAALEGHSEAAVDDFLVSGGPLPGSAVRVEFVENFASTDMDPMLPTDVGNLTGGTGVGVLISRHQSGRA